MVKPQRFPHAPGSIRRKNDFYETHYSITRQLLDNEPLPKDWVILEPACGQNAIVRVLNEEGYENIVARDLEYGDDFLTLEGEHYNAVITNPPYSKAREFVLKAQEVADYVAMFLPLNYLHGQTRYHELWTNNPFTLSRVYVFTRYPLLGEPLREDGKYPTGMLACAWYIWDRRTAGQEPIIRWVNNNPYVFSKREKG